MLFTQKTFMQSLCPFQVFYPPAESAGLLCLINWCLSTLRIIKRNEAKNSGKLRIILLCAESGKNDHNVGN